MHANYKVDLQLEALRKAARLVEDHGAGALHGFIGGLEHARAMEISAPIAAEVPAVQVTQEERDKLFEQWAEEPLPVIADQVQPEREEPTPPEPERPEISQPEDEEPSEPAAAKAATEKPLSKKDRILAAWQSGVRDNKALAAAADCGNGSVYTYLSVLRKEGKIPSEGSQADAGPGKQPRQSEDPPPPLTSASSPSTTGEGWSAALDAMTELRDAAKTTASLSSENPPSQVSHGRPAPSESPSPATTSSTGSPRSQQPKPSRDEMMARVGSFSLPSTKTPATAAVSTDQSPRIPNSTGDASPYGGRSC